MASESKVMSIEKIQQAETILFLIERPAIFLFVFLGGTTRFLHYSMGLFVFTNFFYASLAFDRLFVTPRPKEPSHSKLFFVERYGIWLEAMYFSIALPVYRYAAAVIFVIVNMKFIMNLVGMSMSHILNPTPKADKMEEEKEKSLTVEESQEEKEKEESPEEKGNLNERKVPETETILSPGGQMVSNKEEDEEEDDDSDYDDDGEDDDDQEDEPEVNEETLLETESFEPVVSKEKLLETEDTEPDVQHEMGKAASIENSTVEKEIVSNKGDGGDVEDDEEENDYSDDEDDDDYEEEEEDDDSEDYSYYDSDSDSYDDDKEEEEEEEESDDEQEDDNGEEGIRENESSEKETKTEEIQENVHEAKDNSPKDEEVKETENEKKAGEESKEKRNDAITWEVIEEIEGELRTHILREEEDRHAHLSETNAAFLIKEKELLLVQDFEARSRNWEDERKSLTSKLDDANEYLKIYQENEKKYEDERLEWENEKDFMSSYIEDIYTAWKDLEEKCSKFEEENKLLLKISTNCPPSIDKDHFSLIVNEYDSKCRRLEKEKEDLHATLTSSLHECESKCKSLQEETGYLHSRLTSAAAEVDFYRVCMHNLGLLHN